ncbi:Thyroid transcription factor 1-associated protein 26-like protein [Frankliniella fusca]|uniref:Thyroid transcription factor 1-associated protein 26-like protein n=1 Tax=Frankliniella fusca TaxID=407009 RepID=A0AAE1LMD1_9NEOP|nr:Thyroid transcription factor 1-associated protein 26-like protein [Frankliniella fusca]KAK3924740.1 Thyroid transcription factor 1-associated protein 26-like protein [Frankliniella fusca]
MMNNTLSPKSKTPFDKSKWRQKKYSHKSKVQEFEEKRRKSALHKYYKELKKSHLNPPEKHGNCGSWSEFQEEISQVLSNGLAAAGRFAEVNQESNPFEKAKEELEKRKKEKDERIAMKQKQKAERADALQKYKKDKIRKYMKLKKKTKKGQPVMAGRMELLLEKIQKKMGT